MIQFLAVWSLVITAFACTGLLMFAHNTAFKSITDTFYFLICAALGNWDASAFERTNWDIMVIEGNFLKDRDIYMGKVFLLIFQVFNAVILLNFVIAVLSATYSELQPQSLGLYYDTLINTIKQRSSSKYNSALTSTY